MVLGARIRTLGWLLVLLGVAACQSATPASRPAWWSQTVGPWPIDEAAARAAVERFIGAPTTFELSGPVGTGLGPMWAINGPTVQGEISAGDGSISSLTLTSLAPTTTVVKIDAAAAEAAARAYLAARGVSVEGLTESTTLADASPNRYTVTFQKLERGIEVPVRTGVGVNPETGAVFSFSNDRLPYVSPPDPRISRDEAIRRANELAPGQAVTGTPHLAVGFDGNGTQTLVWQINYPVTSVEVDAISGAATVTGQG
jgi:hypothetical protein